MIGLLGYYGHGSRGDDLLQYALTQLFGETYAFTVSSPGNPTPVPLEQVNAMDALIVGGGTLLGTAMPYPLCDPDWIEGVEVPLYVFGAGAKFPHRAGFLKEGRLASEVADAHHVLKHKSRFFGVRGPLTQGVLGREGIISTVIGDPVLALTPIETQERSSTWLVNFREPAWFGQADYRETAQQWVEKLDQVVPLQGLAFDEADANFMHSIGLPADVSEVCNLSAMMQGCAGLIAMRLHACVLAAICGTPFLNLGYELKSWDFQSTIAPTNPIGFVPDTPDVHFLMRQWHIFGTKALRNSFLALVKLQVRHWRKVLMQKAEAILEEVNA